MSNKSKKGVFTGSGALIALAIAAGMLLSVGGPTSAQFFNFGGYQQRPQPQRGGGWFGGGWSNHDFFDPFQRAPPLERRQSAPPREDFSRAPPPEKRETVPTRNVLVIGDAMPSTTALSLKAFLRSRHKRRMPDFIMSSSDTSNVVDYILSLKR